MVVVYNQAINVSAAQALTMRARIAAVAGATSTGFPGLRRPPMQPRPCMPVCFRLLGLAREEAGEEPDEQLAGPVHVHELRHLVTGSWHVS